MVGSLTYPSHTLLYPSHTIPYPPLPYPPLSYAYAYPYPYPTLPNFLHPTRTLFRSLKILNALHYLNK